MISLVRKGFWRSDQKTKMLGNGGMCDRFFGFVGVSLWFYGGGVVRLEGKG